MADPRVALVQLGFADGDKERNLAAAADAVAEAAAGADLVVLPEMVLTGFPLAQMPALAEPLDGPSVRAFRQMASEHGVTLVAGMPRRDKPGGRIFNTTLAISPHGDLLAAYDKTHLFDREKTVFTPGDSLDGLFTFAGVRCGLLCCFDIELPETARTLALQGIECLVVPSANMEPWGEHHRVFARSRALENHVFVAYANAVGPASGHVFEGRSCLVDPFGRVLCDAEGRETIVWGDLDLSVIDESRGTIDYLSERRPELYG